MTRGLEHALGRFGFKVEDLRSVITETCNTHDDELFGNNEKSILFDPQTAACAYAIAAILDRIHYGTFPRGTVEEALAGQLALVASQVAVKPDLYAEHFKQLSQSTDSLQNDPIQQLYRAIAAGWNRKWRES